MGTALGSIVAVGALVGILVAWTWGGVWWRGRPRAVGRAELIVVFGAEAFPLRPSAELAARLDHAARLWRAGHAPRVLCSGGRTKDVSEPDVMAAALRRAGVPGEALLTDPGGVCTRSTLAGVRRSDTRVLAVSSPYHMRRIELEARRQRVVCELAPAPATPIMRSARHRCLQQAREVAAIWWYALSGRRRARRVRARELVDLAP